MRSFLVLVIFALSPPLCASQYELKNEIGYPFYDSFSADFEKFRMNLDITRDIKALSFRAIDNKISYFSGRFLFKTGGIKEGFAFRGNYTLDVPLEIKGNNFQSKSSLALGVLDAWYSAFDEKRRFEHTQYLYGFSQYFGFSVGELKQFRSELGGQVAYSTISNYYGDLAEWDNYGFRFKNYFVFDLNESAAIYLSGGIAKQKYNPEKYFFTEKWTTEAGFNSGIGIFWGIAEIIPMFNYKIVDIERNGRLDLQRPEYGIRVILKDIFYKNWNLSVTGIYAPWHHKQGNEKFISAGLITKNFNAEIFHRAQSEKFSDFMENEYFTGIQLAWKFGDSKRKPEIYSIDDYAYAPKDKYSFYLNDGSVGDRNLSFNQQAERLGTFRKRNEWSGQNLKYLLAADNGWGFRDANEVYRLRGGDCDEQACHNVAMDTLNGYPAYTLAYWDLSQWLGHGVELVKDPTNGQWFLDEYGMIYKINVELNATPEKAALEAIRQNHRDLALEIIDVKSSEFALVDCRQPGIYEFITPIIPIGWIPEGKHRPNVEYGYELWTGRGFLFDEEK